MAKRSDFAQKLLDDLRLRKERMAASQRSSQSHHLPVDLCVVALQYLLKVASELKVEKESILSNSGKHAQTDAYAYTKQTYRGSRNTKANEIVSSRNGEMPNRSSRRQRSVNTGELSNQVIPYGKGQSSGNVSQALAFAFENGGKLRRADFSYANSIMGFLHQIKRGTMERGSNLDRQLASTSHYPTLSLVQINEISKGAQKLNHILRACSNGLNMDTYSLQFAKELLQGAIDLEESLRMLVEVQKSTEFKITQQAQNKNRITLLEEDNDEEDDTRMEISEQMQLARPTFSFDKPFSRQHFMQRPITLARNSNVKQSTSSGAEISERKNQTTSNPEKGRIPNVIAKLMGLDNLPVPDKVEMESKHMLLKDSCNTQKMEGNSKHTAKTELKNKQTPMAMKNQKVTQDEELIFASDKNEKPLWSDPDGIKALKGFDKASIKTDKPNKSSAQKNLIRESQNYAQVIGRKQNHPNNSNREQKGTVKGRTNDPVLNNMLAQLEQVHQRSLVKSSIQVEKEINASIILQEKRHANKHILSNEKKSRNHLGVQKSYILSKNWPQEEKHHREQQLQPREEQMLIMRPQGGSEMTPKNSSKPPHQLINPQKKQPSINQPTMFKKNYGENVAAVKSSSCHYDDHDLVRDEASNDTNEKVKEIINRRSGQISSPRDQEFERAKGRHGHGIKTLKDEKHVHKLASKKIKNTRKQKVDMPGKIDRAKLVTEKGKQPIPSLQEASDRASGEFNVLNGAEQERNGTFREAYAPIISSNELVPVAVRCQPHKEAELPPTLHSSGGAELQTQQEPANDLHYQDEQSVAINLQEQAVPGAADEAFKTGEVALHKTNGIQDDGMGINRSQLQDQSISAISLQQPLTESENCLKWNLVMSQLFVNTAEALFRLNIPFSVLQGGRQDNQDEGSKLILDCGYEVMKRKGIRQELRVHTCSISTVNIRSLDDLVRQLKEDMEKLKFYGREKSTEVDVEDYLPKMLEHDVYDKYPDIDCMWDFGWNDETLAFIEKYDVVRDTEKHILSVLLDEITKDCCMFNED